MINIQYVRLFLIGFAVNYLYMYGYCFFGPMIDRKNLTRDKLVGFDSWIEQNIYLYVLLAEVHRRCQWNLFLNLILRRKI